MKKQLSFIIFSLLLLSHFSGNVRAEPMRASETFRGERVFLPASSPEKGRLTLLSFTTLTFEREILGAVAVYDDPATKRSGDYLELYNLVGKLLMVSWFDRFGIRRTAMDRGLLEEAGKPEGVLILLLEGDPA